MKHKNALVQILGVCVLVLLYFFMIEARVRQSETKDVGFVELLSHKYPLNRVFIIAICVVIVYVIIPFNIS